jgi:hypothetical protein
MEIPNHGKTATAKRQQSSSSNQGAKDSHSMERSLLNFCKE